MKKIIYLVIFFLISKYSFSQDEQPAELNQIFLKRADSVVLQKANLDFSIPDIPAFKSLGIDPSNILRPSAVKDFALMLNNFSGSSFSAIPKNIAVEVAPALFLKPWYTLQDYRQKTGLRTLTKTRISLGTNEDEETKVSSIALGLRTTIFDRGDFRLDEAFQKENIFSKMEILQKDLSARSRSVIIEMGGPVAFSELPDSRQREIRDSLFTEVQNNAGFILDTIVRNSISKYKKNNWNASRMDFAYALLLESADSLISTVKFKKHLFWATLALKPGAKNTWAQILLGANSTVYNINSKWVNAFTGNLRFYAGTNKFKGLFEMQYQSKNNIINPDKSTLFTQLGIEVSFFSGMWIQFSTGIFNALEGDNKSALKSNLNLSISFPENFRFF